MLKTLLQCFLCLSKTIPVEWNLEWLTVSPDGYQRRAIGANGVWPIAPIEGNLGDVLQLKIINKLPSPTAIHSHGLFQNGTNYYDGVYGITQCGIPPNGEFTYNISLAQMGTYWIHGHVDGQYVDGLQTPLIIKPPQNTTLPYEEEFTISLSDWYHKEHRVLLDHYMSIYNPSGAEPIPDAALINHKREDSFRMQPGKTYRFRFISMTSLSMYTVWMEGHEMEIIELDGVDVEPFSVDSFSISAAQRVSVLVKALNQTNFNYRINAEMNPMMFDGPPPEMNRGVVNLIYDPKSPFSGDPSLVPEDSTVFSDETLLKPVRVADAVAPTKEIVLDADFTVYNDGVNHGSFNHIPFHYPLIPTLFTALSTGANASSDSTYGKNTHPFVLDHLAVVQIVINNLDGNPHPFHIHGHEFQVLGKGEGLFDPSTVSLNMKNPVRRDTVVVPGEGYAVISFRADNPGVWLMHCHVEWHLQAGLALQFIEAPLEIQKRIKVPEAVYDQCRASGIPITGNGAGTNDTKDLAKLEPLTVWPDYITGKGIGALIGCIFSAILGLVVVIWFSSTSPATSSST